MKKILLILSSTIGLIYGAFIFLAYAMNSIYYEPFGIDITQWTSDWNEWISITFDGLVNFCFMLAITFLTCGLVMMVERATYYAASVSQKKHQQIIIRCGYVFLALTPIILLLIKYIDAGLTTVPSDFPVYGLACLFSLSLYTRKYFPKVLFISVEDIKKRWILAVIFILLMFSQPFAFVRERFNELRDTKAITTAYYNHERIDSLLYLGSTRQYYFLHARKTKVSYVLRRDSTKLVMRLGKQKLVMK